MPKDSDIGGRVGFRNHNDPFYLNVSVQTSLKFALFLAGENISHPFASSWVMAAKAVFCGNFEYDARQSEIERLFDRYGRVDRVDMKTGNVASQEMGCLRSVWTPLLAARGTAAPFVLSFHSRDFSFLLLSLNMLRGLSDGRCHLACDNLTSIIDVIVIEGT